MVCPRCSLHNPKGTVVCGRCGEVAPKAAELTVDTRPPADGPRATEKLQRDVPLDRRGRGVRAVGASGSPGGVRMRAAARLRARTDEIERRVHLARAADAARNTTEGAAALDSFVHHARTEPNWHRLPLEPPVADEPDTNPGPAAPHVAVARGVLPVRAANSDPESARRVSDPALREAVRREAVPAPVGLRAAAAFVDGLVVLAAVAVAWGFAALALGTSVVGAHLDRGLDAVIDGLFVARGLGALTVAFGVVVAYAYLTLSHALVGASFGKQLLGLRVQNAVGRTPSLGAAAARTAFAFVLTLPGGLSWFSALFDQRMRTLHDWAVGTRVVVVPEDEPVVVAPPSDDASA